MEDGVSVEKLSTICGIPDGGMFVDPTEVLIYGGETVEPAGVGEFVIPEGCTD